MVDSGSARRWRLGAPTPDRSIVRLWRDSNRQLTAAVETVFSWIERARERRQLAALSVDALKDLDISRADAEAEYRKYFWQR
jgi:uncharacterized protein YjiS (DUF1127 family)